MNFDFALLNTGFVQLDQPLCYDNAYSNFSRVIVIKEGSGTIVCGNEEHDVVPGHMYLVPPMIHHSARYEAPVSFYYVHFADLSMRIFDHFHIYHYNLEVPTSEDIIQLVSFVANAAPGLRQNDIVSTHYDSPSRSMQRIKEFRQLPAADRMAINGLLHVLLSRFMDQNAPSASVSDIRISKAVWGINRNLADIPSLDELSAKACMNKNTFIRLFHEQTGFTPTNYIIHRRMLHAQLLFMTGNYSVKAVAHQVGYDNISYFGRTFKRLVGVSPLHFIQQNRGGD